jgi:hypothetical protein
MKPELAGRIALTAATVCLATVGVTVGALAMPAVRTKIGLAPVMTPSYAPGDRIDLPASTYEASSYTVILFVRSDCGVCQRIKPWLTQLAATLQRQPAVRVVVVASGGHASDEVRYAAELGVGSERVFVVPSGALKLRSVPAFVLVDQRGAVRYSQEGAPRAQPDQVATAMTSLILPR